MFSIITPLIEELLRRTKMFWISNVNFLYFRMFDHTLEVPMLKIASLGRFKQFIKMFKLGGQATDKLV